MINMHGGNGVASERLIGYDWMAEYTWWTEWSNSAPGTYEPVNYEEVFNKDDLGPLLFINFGKELLISPSPLLLLTCLQICNYFSLDVEIQFPLESLSWLYFNHPVRHGVPYSCGLLLKKFSPLLNQLFCQLLWICVRRFRDSPASRYRLFLVLDQNPVSNLYFPKIAVCCVLRFCILHNVQWR